MMTIADMHCDSLTDTVEKGAPFIRPYNMSDRGPHLQFAAAFVGSAREPATERQKRLLRFADAFEETVTAPGGIRPIRTANDLHLFRREGGRAALFSLEGGGGFTDRTDALPLLYDRGLRVMGLAWDDNELACSAWSDFDTGLTLSGKKVLSRMMGIGIIPDLSHLSDRSIYDVFEQYDGAVLATHSNLRTVCSSPRNLTPDHAKEIARRGGVIGLNLYPAFVGEDERVLADAILRHVDGLVELVGDRAIGFGFDIDGTDGKYPDGIGTERSIHDQVVELLDRRYPSETVMRIAGENVLDFLGKHLPENGSVPGSPGGRPLCDL